MSLSKVVLILSVLISSGLSDDNNRCGEGWVQLSRDKCYRVAQKSPVTWEEAVDACGSVHGPYLPSILTIKSGVESRALQNYLYNQLYITDPVWIGAQRDNNTLPFEWSDGSHLEYTNWDTDRPSKDVDSNCAQFNPRSTKWTDTSCSSKAVVVCQKLQIWSFPELFQEFFDWRTSMELRFERLTEELERKDERIEQLEDRLGSLNDNYNDLSDKFNRLRENLENEIESAVGKLQDDNDKVRNELQGLDDRTDKLEDKVKDLEKECSAGCSGGDGGVTDSQLEDLRKELKKEIDDRVSPIEDKIDSCVTDARLEIISFRRTLQIQKKGQWISLGYV